VNSNSLQVLYRPLVVLCSLLQASEHQSAVQRVNLKDYLIIYTEGCSHEDSRRFRIGTQDAEDFAWAPDSSMLAVWDSPLSSLVLVYKPDGTCISKHQSPDAGLGVRAAAWSACGQYLAIGSYAQVRATYTQCMHSAGGVITPAAAATRTTKGARHACAPGDQVHGRG
jgi:hypothetical protein